jgi:peptide/nickel transport system permease protein
MISVRKIFATIMRKDITFQSLETVNLWKYIITQLLRNKKGITSLGIISVLALIGIFAEFIAPYPYDAQDLQNMLRPPSIGHIFGTDALGRDVLSRIIYGARITIFIGFAITFLTAILGIMLGLIAGYFGGVIDMIISKIIEIFWAFPIIVIALGLTVVLGPGIRNVILVLGILLWVPFAKVIRTKTLVIRENSFVKYAKAIGLPSIKIIIKHIFLNVVPDIIVLFALTIPDAIISSAALSFLGLGVQPPTPEWGAILSDGRLYLMIAPWISVFPGIFLLILALSFNILGDVLRDVLDPFMRGRK